MRKTDLEEKGQVCTAPDSLFIEPSPIMRLALLESILLPQFLLALTLWI